MKPDSVMKAGRGNNLVIVRAGKNSLHESWIAPSDTDRDFDLVVSYFDEDAYNAHQEQDRVEAFFKVGGKWDGLYATLEWLGSRLDDYAYVWLPDDDIATDAKTINRLFALMRTHDMAVAQPSLTPDSYFTHFLFINCPRLQLRYTNYVEIMVPCLRLDLLKMVMPHFRETMSGFGLDYIWCRLPQSGIDRSGIFDSISVRHTRPVGKVLMSRISANGKSAKDEEAALNALYGIEERITPLCYGALTTDGKRISGLGRTGLAMVLRHLTRLPGLQRKDRSYGFGRLVQLIRRQLTRKMTMEPLNGPFDRRGANQQTA
ncbi:hypothetical protein NAC44_05630 [Allorhizobium sp. BGMRC 0089]|uniref:hypothetical protein n=1 Tax=Allorhizobium sonneratiae TaxID=2934936 RepID=UPI0020338975|nr:hypothetical protein [Allorhizobium sonneratiae]MCM2291806.1 hypothetical protein [Allorhizobium sonneratiae]